MTFSRQDTTSSSLEKKSSDMSLKTNAAKSATGVREQDLSKVPSGSHLSLRAVQPIDVEVCDFSLHVDTTPSILQNPSAALWKHFSLSRRRAPFKTVLDGVTASMPHGTLTAIIGGSGSGKTSLLNVMAGRMGTSRMKVTGTAKFNSSGGINGSRSAYLMQQDVLIPTLTVRETLQYSADLRLPPPTTAEERRAVVEKVILELGLKECADTRIGNNLHKGCSGGEKRRTSIGVQMLGNPSVLFCDEPTTGLDATSAYQVVRSLKRLALDGRTIIISIHSPRSEIWGLFDKVVLLSRGSVLYSGAAERSLAHFETLGHSIPPFVNPAEFLIDLAAYDNRTAEAELASQTRIETLKVAWRAASSKISDQNNISPAGKEFLPQVDKQESVGFTRQFQVLTARTIKMTIRDPMGMTSCLFEAIGMAALNGWIYLRLDGSLTGIRSRQGSLYTASSLNGYIILLYEIFRLTTDIQLFDRERSEGVVGVPAFLLSRRAARLFLEDLPVPMLFSTIFYFMVGYRLAAAEFFIFLVLNILTQYTAVTFAAVCISICRHFPGASLAGNLSYTLQTVACGYFVQVNQIPVYVRWVKWGAYTFYAFSALCANEFIGPNGPEYGQFYDCPYSKDPTNPQCKEYTGQFVIDSLGIPRNWIWRSIIALASFTLFFYILAGLILQFNKIDINVAQPRKAEKDLSVGKEKFVANTPGDNRQVSIKLEKYSLDIQKRSLTRRGLQSQTLNIIKPITTEFEPGKLNVIMGPSGSGKTSLLCSISNRLQGSIGTRYCVGGNMLYNDAVPSKDVVRSVTSFVTQDDDALMPSLTVRESLEFAAGLRLPSWMSKEEKNQRAEAILLKMGLKDCANNLIGSDLIKGISGGEKRRVSIAIQILTDPKILLLDEPTSGLDVFTATSIIEVLNGLAAEGRTLILTIHQSRSDIFQYFSNVLLIARGGYPVYAGSGADMLPHFESLGYECPQTTNPTDFALDLITVDLQAKTREAATRTKVQSLIDNWEVKPHEKDVAAPVIAAPAELGSLKRKAAAFRSMFALVLRRSTINLRRQPYLLLARTMQVIGVAIIMTLFFAPLKHDYAAVQSTMGAVQQITALYFVGMLQNIAIYPYERDVFYREESDDCYSTEAFILQYTTLEVPFEIMSSLIYGVASAYAIGLRRSVKMLFVSSFNAFCITSCGESLGIMFCTLFSHIGFSVNITSIVLSIATVLGGVMSLNIPSVLQAINHLSPVKYSISNLAPYAMRGRMFTCTDDQRLPNGHCPIETGEQVLLLYNLDKDPKINIMALGICVIGYRLVAYALIKVVRSRSIRENLLGKFLKRPNSVKDSGIK
ncbi:ATP-dependent ABC transporter [Arthroderma uncinatum]|uniref:ATP-dependent ABC transporter n=1 Tax=Arthroderma uncinatum TaxID=74035 RepID=UPI00144A57C7|nr:ATP-dependent ABC transporter [Arthroderma uncinatum]KAF3490953.1 ATP-dependent ABC transporter [Arthroderma uncinatum]